MAMHMRRQIRAAVVAALQAVPALGQNVWAARDWPLGDSKFPAALVYGHGGDSAFDAMAAADADVILERDERLVVEGRVRAGGSGESPSIDDALDDLALAIETALMTDAGLGALVDRRELVNTALESQIAGDASTGTVKLTYRIVYATAAGAPQTKV